MNPLPQLKQIRHEMFEELTRMPQYRAAHAMKKFLDEMGVIYGPNAAAPLDPLAESERISKAIEKRITEGPTEPQHPRVRAFSP